MRITGEVVGCKKHLIRFSQVLAKLPAKPAYILKNKKVWITRKKAHRVKISSLLVVRII